MNAPAELIQFDRSRYESTWHRCRHCQQTARRRGGVVVVVLQPQRNQRILNTKVAWILGRSRCYAEETPRAPLVACRFAPRVVVLR